MGKAADGEEIGPFATHDCVCCQSTLSFPSVSAAARQDERRMRRFFISRPPLGKGGLLEPRQGRRDRNFIVNSNWNGEGRGFLGHDSPAAAAAGREATQQICACAVGGSI